MLDPLEQELQESVSCLIWILRTKPRSSVRAESKSSEPLSHLSAWCFIIQLDSELPESRDGDDTEVQDCHELRHADGLISKAHMHLA